MNNKGGELEVGVCQCPTWIFTDINAAIMSVDQGRHHTMLELDLYGSSHTLLRQCQRRYKTPDGWVVGER